MTPEERELLIAVARAILHMQGGVGDGGFIGPNWIIKDAVRQPLQKLTGIVEQNY